MNFTILEYQIWKLCSFGSRVANEIFWKIKVLWDKNYVENHKNVNLNSISVYNLDLFRKNIHSYYISVFTEFLFFAPLLIPCI